MYLLFQSLTNFIVGAGLYYLSQDSSNIKFDPKVHTLSKLHEVLDDIYYEYATAYIFYYNMMMNMKDQGKLDETAIENMRVTI